MNTLSKWYQIRAAAQSKAADILIFGEIGESWWSEGTVTAHELVKELAALDVGVLNIRINSYGGAVSDGLAIYNALRRHRAEKRVTVEGVAVSIASLIAMAGDTIDMPANTLLMIHAPWGFVQGNAADMRETADTLDRYAQAMASSYARKSKQSEADMLALLRDGKDHWYTADEAKTAGFADTVSDAIAIQSSLPMRFRASAPSFTTVGKSPMSNDVQDAIRHETLTAKKTRRQEIKNLLIGHNARNPELVAVLNDCLDDPACTVDMASQRLLKKMGEGAESIGGAGAIAVNFPMPTGSLAREFAAFERSMSNPIAFGGRGRNDFLAATSDALAQRWGARLKNPHPGVRDLQGTSLTGFAQMVLSANGHNPIGMNRAQLAQAAMTTSDFPVLVGDAANKVLGTRFEQITTEHRALCDKGNLVDFKKSSVVNTSFLPGLTRKYEGGEIEYGAITEGSTQYQLATYARGLQITREVIVNDDLDAFGSLLQNTAVSGARLERDLIFATLTGNPIMGDGVALFDAVHGNIDTSGREISISGLAAARVLMRKQRDASGGYVLTAPRFLVVPVAREGEAEALVASLTYRPAANTELQTPDWVRGLTVIADPRLDEVDPEDWYLLSDPTVAPTIRLGYLNGRDTPEVFEDVDFDRDVLRFKIRFDVAVAATGWSGAVKMA